MIGNQITLPTWRWLKVNETDVKTSDIAIKPYTARKMNPARPSDAIETEIQRYPNGFSTDPKEVQELSANHIHYVHVEAGQCQELLKLTYPLSKENPTLIDQQTIIAEEGAQVSVLYDYYNEDDARAFRHTELRVLARKNARVKVYLVQRHNEETLSIQSVMSVLGDAATLEIVEVEAGAYQTYFNYRASLMGRGAKVDVQAVYFGYRKEGINLFYNFDHYGEKTDANVMVHGALKHEAHKMFKASLDFKKGSCGSVGNEEEFVTLMDEGVHSVAVPLLLCQEDDVVGNHASSAGRIASDTLFYIMSRGISKKEAEKMIVESTLMPTIDRVPDPALRATIWSRMEAKLDA